MSNEIQTSLIGCCGKICESCDDDLNCPIYTAYIELIKLQDSFKKGFEQPSKISKGLPRNTENFNCAGNIIAMTKEDNSW